MTKKEYRIVAETLAIEYVTNHLKTMKSFWEGWGYADIEETEATFSSAVIAAIHDHVTSMEKLILALDASHEELVKP